MADVLTRGELFPPQVVEDMFNMVRGKSALAALSGEKPMPFNGTTAFTFTLDKEADLVDECGPKSNGGATVTNVKMVPLKFEYGARVSDEFLYGSEEYRLNVLQNFAEGAARKFARGLDIAAMHRVNPRTGETSTLIPETNAFDTAVTNTTEYDASTPDAALEAATAMVLAGEKDVTGMAIAPAMASALGAMRVNGMPQYPEFRFGGSPETFYGKGMDVNGTVSFGEAGDMAIVGNFADAFRWGYAKNIPLEVIEYGDPDNSGQDLRGYNQVYLRAEAYIGWGILDADSFAIVNGGTESE